MSKLNKGVSGKVIKKAVENFATTQFVDTRENEQVRNNDTEKLPLNENAFNFIPKNGKGIVYTDFNSFKQSEDRENSNYVAVIKEGVELTGSLNSYQAKLSDIVKNILWKVTKVWYNDYSYPRLFTEFFEPMEYGGDAQETFTNVIDPIAYSNVTPAIILENHFADTRACYYRVNSQVVFPISIPEFELRKATFSYDDMANFVNTQYLNVMTQSTIKYENDSVLQMLVNAFNDGFINGVQMPDPTLTQANALQFIAKLYGVKHDMYNGNTKFIPSNILDTVNKPIQNPSNFNDIYICMESSVLTSAMVLAVSGMFNLDPTILQTNIISVPEFPQPKKTMDIFKKSIVNGKVNKIESKIMGTVGRPLVSGRLVGLVFDKRFLKLTRNVDEVGEFYNPGVNTKNFYQHLHNIFDFSSFNNVYAITVDTTGKLVVESNVWVGNDEFHKPFEIDGHLDTDTTVTNDPLNIHVDNMPTEPIEIEGTINTNTTITNDPLNIAGNVNVDITSVPDGGLNVNIPGEIKVDTGIEEPVEVHITNTTVADNIKMGVVADTQPNNKVTEEVQASKTIKKK